MKKITLFIISFLIIAGTFYLIFFKSSIIGNLTLNSNNDIKIPLYEISENAKWYEYDLEGVKIKFFAVKAKDGTIKTAFDACDVCYPSKKGYRQEGEYMICNNCGSRFPIIGLGTENQKDSGCWPGYLPNKIEGVNLVIKISDLEKGMYRFE